MKKSTVFIIISAAFISAGWLCFDIKYLGISLLVAAAIFAATALVCVIRDRKEKEND